MGAGPAGSATALSLLRAAPELRGQVVLLERERLPRPKVCAGAVAGRADRLLRRLEAPVEVPSVDVVGLSVATGFGSQCARSPDERPIGRVVRRSEFDAALVEQARARGVEVRADTAVTGLGRDDRALRLTTTAGPLTARVVVGADGVGSTVRRALGLSRGHSYARAVEVRTGRVAADPPADLLHFDLCDPSLVGYGWCFPAVADGPGQVSRGLYELVRGAPRAPRSEPLLNRLTAQLHEQGLRPDAAAIRAYAVRGYGPRERVATERVLLVGEAAGVDPVLGEGIAQALGYGEHAGRYLARRLRAGELDFRDYARSLRRERLGLDLRIRATALPWIYGSRRPRLEAWIARSPGLAQLGLHGFAGRPIPRRHLAAAALDLARAWLGA